MITNNNKEKYDIFKVKKVNKINRRAALITAMSDDDNTSSSDNDYDTMYDPYDYDTLSDLD